MIISYATSLCPIDTMTNVLLREQPQTAYVYQDWAFGNVVVDDLWYARRPGPDAVMRRKALVWGKDLPPSGRFTALCHAKLPAFYRWPSWLPPNALQFDQIYAYDPYVGAVVPADVVRGMRQFTITATMYEQRVLQKAGLAVQAVRCYKCNISYFRGAAVVDFTVSDRWFEDLAVSTRVREERYWNESRLDWLELEQGWSPLDMELYGDALTQVTTPYRDEWLAPAPYTIPTSKRPSADYVKAEASRLLHNALQFEDIQLVDWSVGNRAEPPWALQNIHMHSGKARAFIEATEDIPLANENMLQCIAEAFAGMACFVSGGEAAVKYFDAIIKARSPIDWYKTNRFGQTSAQRRHAERLAARRANMARWDPHGIANAVDDWRNMFGNAWLTGRYVFSTSVMDAEQGWEYFYDQAQQWLGTRSGDYKCHASVELDLEQSDRKGKLACTFTCRERALEGVTKAFEAMYRYGLEPNAYVMWDFVPYSFVVDWFLPIGNCLHAYTRSTHFTPEFWEFQPVYDGRAFCYSISYTSDSPFGQIEVYTRWYEPSPPEVESAYFWRRESPSQNTVCKRLVDGIALFHMER